MYRNFGSQGGGNPPYTGNVSGSNSASLTSASASATQPEQKFTMAGSSQFVPSLNAITTNQDLQWLVQPSFMHAAGPSHSSVPPYPTTSGARPLGPPPSHSHQLRRGVIRAAANASVSTRHWSEEHLSREELERRRIRRERNKLAAAKCRNRRRELTDTLQKETDELEDEKSHLQKEIAQLQKEKDKLELVLEAHRPICKIEDSESDSDPNPSVSSMGGVKIEPGDFGIPGCSKPPTKMDKPKPKITLPSKSVTSFSSAVVTESESLHTPVLTSTPSMTAFTSGMVFTYPSAPPDTTNPSTSSHAPSHQGGAPQSHARETCGIAYRRSSSSGDQSDHSLHSPTILTL
ncbi:fos-related antigen 1a [Brachionichthys hirsutus]|uniref:fos-related antigen 1a n=1 Tax=Brachionichthys hirsutus TaxID=412623 RepID=UPI00360498E4